MDIVWFRDLTIIIMGVMATLFLLIMVVLALAIFRRIKDVSKSVKEISVSVQEVVTSVKATTDNIASMSSFACSEMAEPLHRTAGLVQGVLRGCEAVLSLFKRKGK
ncbi:MAG: hypothetical protein FWH51_02630 [Dehalococcoidia bacterium]|nr:hypothetical protein [Dehalococcoidia bacterium]